jgi:hypothetical protein
VPDRNVLIAPGLTDVVRNAITHAADQA